MEPFTLDRTMHKKDVIDGSHSIIWTERYYGDGDVEIVVPATNEWMTKLPEGQFISVDGSDEVMMIETRNFDEPGKMKVSGISLLQWLNERFVRTSANPEDRYWYLTGFTPGSVLWEIVSKMCVAGSPYLDGTIDTGIDDPETLVVPGLALQSYDDSGEDIRIGVPFGPLYDAIKEIATTYKVGMQITLDEVTDLDFTLGFRSYRGADRTTIQDLNQPVRFSPHTDTFSNIKEIQSIAAYKTKVYAFAPANPDGLATVPGKASIAGTPPTGFDLRAKMIFADDITTDQVEGEPTNLVDVLNSRAADEITNSRRIKAVDGEIMEDNQYRYKTHYFLGDIVEVQGNTNTIQASRVTEYIRTQDASGYREYPTLEYEGDITTQALHTLSGVYIAGEE